MFGPLSKLVNFFKSRSHRFSDGFFRWKSSLSFSSFDSTQTSGRRGNSGNYGEKLATLYLKKIGYRIIAEGYRTQLSEIDIIALDQRTVVFVEVKTWSRGGEGGPADAVDSDKQQRLTRAALVFLKKKRLLENPARFDVIEVILSPDGSAAGKNSAIGPTIRHFKNAFEATGKFQMFS